MVEDGLSNDKKRGKLTGDATSAERMAFGRMVHHTHNALQGELRPTKEAQRDVRRAKRSEEKRNPRSSDRGFRFS